MVCSYFSGVRLCIPNHDNRAQVLPFPLVGFLKETWFIDDKMMKRTEGNVQNTKFETQLCDEGARVVRDTTY